MADVCTDQCIHQSKLHCIRTFCMFFVSKRGVISNALFIGSQHFITANIEQVMDNYNTINEDEIKQ